MNSLLPFGLPALVLLMSAPPSFAESTWTARQRELLSAMERLSAATAPGGKGPSAYAAVLSDDFSRWTVGSETLNDKQAWVEGMRGWFDDGWRVADREVRTLELQVRGRFAFSRRIVTETYAGPADESSTSSAALAETWRREGGRWRLLRVDVHPLPAEGAR